MAEKLLVPREVAQLLDISEASLAQLRYKGTGPAYIKLNSRAVRYERSAVEAWLVARTVTGEGPT